MNLPFLKRRHDEKSVEMLRVWIAEHRLWCSIKVGVYADTAVNEEKAWGVILADATRHIAAALESSQAAKAAETIWKIRASYLTELSRPTSEAKGDFV
ncbi:MAG: DUF5076 domain-containing protein [bacterium]